MGHLRYTPSTHPELIRLSIGFRFLIDTHNNVWGKKLPKQEVKQLNRVRIKFKTNKALIVYGFRVKYMKTKFERSTFKIHLENLRHGI